MLAEIADKMPSIGECLRQWGFIGSFCALFTVATSLIRWWLGGVFALVIGGFWALGALPDSAMDDAIVKELGNDYLSLYRIATLIPLALSIASWLMTSYLLRRHKLARN